MNEFVSCIKLIIKIKIIMIIIIIIIIIKTIIMINNNNIDKIINNLLF